LGVDLLSNVASGFAVARRSALGGPFARDTGDRPER